MTGRGTYRAAAAVPVARRKFCWYRHGLLRKCGMPTWNEGGLCNRHESELAEEVARLAKLVLG
jgi:hypothetical protein